ncbi:hypothetical protein JAAARDRAFT_177120 [Jaapia argillacea MUCL 33604]|uniref:FAD-binding domain-containing protein n=1 Tax=Jaapia argillacea MUCL 33604 TaxID=933084 RepID=A0A067Q3C7_9AGAM|nr:hypothetical protein JAAARDRAFT_177120 [Jaapia argillacea MUCL 33604]
MGSIEPRLKVAVCGGGVAGLTCAVALSRCPGLEVHLFEAAHNFNEIGAGIGAFPRVWKIMQALGLDKDLAELASSRSESGEPEQLSFTFRKSDQPEGLTFYELVTSDGFYSFHRAEFQQAILKNLPSSCHTYFNKRITTYTEPSSSSPIVLKFQDGTTSTCDVLLGADGIKSAVRRTMLENEIANTSQEEARNLLQRVSPIWSGTVAYRGLIPRPVLEAKLPQHQVFSRAMNYMGQDRHLIVFPISRGQIINVVSFHSKPHLEGTAFDGPSVVNVTKAEMLAEFSDWEPEVQALLDCIEYPSRWAIHALMPLESYISGRVALLGDAAHAMTPHQGSGAGQAIEDAYILSALLVNPLCTRSTLRRALEIYDTVRVPIANRVLEGSRSNGMMYEFNSPGYFQDEVRSKEGAGWDMEKLKEMGEEFERRWMWAWTTTAEGDKQRALEMLSDSCSCSGQ